MRFNLAELDKRTILGGLIVLLLVAVNLAWVGPPSGVGSTAAQEATVTVTRTLAPTEPAESMEMATPTPTPLPAEFLTNYKQTTGIIIVAGVIVLIVVAGVFNQLISDRQSKQS